jgi:hypothetical protein
MPARDILGAWEVARHFARPSFEIARKADLTWSSCRPVTTRLARTINQALDCGEVAIINMDEYLAGGEWIPLDHPLSFRGYVERLFYDLLDPDQAPRPENRVFPDPREPSLVQEVIARARSGRLLRGIINSHVAFKPPAG